MGCIMKDYIKHIFYIIAGYSVWIWNIISGKTKQQAKERLATCNCCKHNNDGICDICSCILKAKVRVDFPLDENGKSIDGCPEKKW